MLYRCAIMLLSASVLAGAAYLKAVAVHGPQAGPNYADAGLAAAEGVLAVCGALFLFGRRTGWILSLVFLVFANYSLYKALAGKPCGCLGAAVVSPWLMVAVDLSLSLSLALTSPWSPWPERRPKWTLLVGAGTCAAVVLAVVVVVFRPPVLATPIPSALADIFESARRNYEGADSERFTIDLELVQDGLAAPITGKVDGADFTLPVKYNSTLVVTRAGKLVSQGVGGDTKGTLGTLLTDGDFQIQYSPKINTAWVRSGDTIGSEPIDVRKYGLPDGWDLASGRVSGAVAWKRSESSTKGPNFVEVVSEPAEGADAVAVVFDRTQNSLPVTITHTTPEGRVTKVCSYTYAPVGETGRFRLGTYSIKLHFVPPYIAGPSATATYTVKKYESGGAVRPDPDFDIPVGTRITDAVAGHQGTAARASKLLAGARLHSTTAPVVPGQHAWWHWAVIAAMDAASMAVVRRRLRAVA